MAITRTESGFPLIAGSYSKLVVRVLHIEARVVLGILEAIEQLGDERERITIFDGKGVELPIIDDKPERTISFLDE